MPSGANLMTGGEPSDAVGNVSARHGFAPDSVQRLLEGRRLPANGVGGILMRTSP